MKGLEGNEFSQLAHFLQCTPVPQFVIGLDHRILFWNRACELYTGLAARDMVGTDQHWRPFYPDKRPILVDFVADGDYEGFLAHYKDSQPRVSDIVADAWEIIEYYPDLRGRARYMNCLAAPMYNASGRRVGAIATAREVSAQERAALDLQREAEQLRQENSSLRETIADRYRFGKLIGRSPCMQELYERIVKAAASHSPVVICGESGTGKELVARAIHRHSSRRHGKFVPVNCSSMAEDFFERGFVGCSQGAPRAGEDRACTLEQADGGTLFLDEVGDLPLAQQAKLLRVLDGLGLAPLGGGGARHPDLRVMAASSRNLDQMIANGALRPDVYFRLNVLPISVPPLRERMEDLCLLVDDFLANWTGGGKGRFLPSLVFERLEAHDWPGNVRELHNVLQRYLTIGRLELPAAPAPEITVSADCGVAVPGLGESFDYQSAMAAFEKELVAKLLACHHWRKGQTAAAMRVSRKTLFRKMKALGLADLP